MHVEQELWTEDAKIVQRGSAARSSDPQLVLAFAATARLRAPKTWADLRARWPRATIVACSTAGEICGPRVFDDSLVATAVEFEKTTVRCASVTLDEAGDSRRAGRLLAERLSAPDLVHLLVLSEGLKVNGSSLVGGLTGALPSRVAVTGGLSGDGARFERTMVCVDEGCPSERVAAVGFYGAALEVGYGSLGGWDPFGLERRITRSDGNVLYELDGEPALDLYLEYLGEHAAGLPASGLLFPLTLRKTRDHPGIVRTILSVDRARGSMTFAGDVPVGFHARLMRANGDRLVDGAVGAARSCRQTIGGAAPELAILISCVGRKLVLDQRVEEEVEAVRDVLGEATALAGFYSYGELSPFVPSAQCELHNQTMTITTFTER